MKMKHLALAVTLAISGNIAFAQETASSIRGVVTTQTGTTVSGASIKLVDNRTGSVRSLTANESGSFSLRGLQVGGPYTLQVSNGSGQTETVENVFLTLGDTRNISVVIRDNVERIAVSGQQLSNPSYGAKSPAANFDVTDLAEMPAINRDLSDVVAADPRIYIDAGFSRGIQCNGASPRFNSLTVDGVRMNDNFGLNNNGYPTERMPFSYDAIQQVAVEFAPFDVNYGGFTACNINAVTKSGKNDIEGSVFFDYTNDSLQGDKLEGTKLNADPFSEKRYGFNVGGALVEDKLFLFAAYEKYEGADTFTRGAADTNAGTPVKGLTQAQLDRIAAIAKNVYGYEVGAPISSTPVEDEKLLLKLDWYLNDMHRLAFTYNYNDGESVRESDSNSNQYEFSDHYFTRGAEFTSYVAQLFSDWNDSFSTDIRLGYSQLDNRQINVGPGGMGEIQITTRDAGSSATVFLGVDDSRQSNKLNYDTTFAKVAGSYVIGDHSISAGYEYEEYNVFNMFVQHTIGEYRFGSIEAFEAGTPSRIYYGNAAGSMNPADAAANFGYAIHTFYSQDEFFLSDYDLTLTYGLRYDLYASSDKPRLNQKFFDRYGFGNDTTFDGEGLLQPRLGVNWAYDEQLELRGGVGLFSGGNPNVWLANGYQNDGFTQVQIEERAAINVLTTQLSGQGRPLFDIPLSIYNKVANGAQDSSVNAVDPNFELPKEWKFSFGGTYTFDSGTIAMADLMYTIAKDRSLVIDRALEVKNTLFDGRKLYGPINGTRTQDFVLTNSSGDAKQLSFSTSASHDFDNGLSGTLAYAYIQSEDANPMGSSVAYSNYTGFARSDMNDPENATSNYETPHRFTFRLTYKHEFVEGYRTTFSLLGSHNKGRPYSYTFGGTGFANDYANSTQLLYVPTGENDPNVVFANTFNKAAFFDFVESSGLSKYAGRISERNAFESDWWTKFDLRITQELPGFNAEHKAQAFFVIDNLTNLLNDDWGVLYEARFPQTAPAVNAVVRGDGKYQFNEFTLPNPQARVATPSLWKMTVGIEYKF